MDINRVCLILHIYSVIVPRTNDWLIIIYVTCVAKKYSTERHYKWRVHLREYSGELFCTSVCVCPQGGVLQVL